MTVPTAIPVSLLTGFLGAGKTTLLNHLLREPKAGRIAVVVNEFGDAGLDHDLVEQAAEDVVLMAAGCICCSIRGDLSRTLTSLLARRQTGMLDFDRVIIETTGLADPGPVHHTLLVDPQLAPHFTLDGIITVVDAVLGADTLDQHSEAQAQVAMADRIVISKMDRARRVDTQALKRRLDRLNPRATRLQANHGAVPVEALFHLSPLRRETGPQNVMDWLSAAPLPQSKDPLAGLSGFSVPQPGLTAAIEPSSHHAFDNRIVTASIEIEEPIAPGVFDFWLETVIAARGADMLRMKAILHIEGTAPPYVIHGVQHIFEPPVPLKTWPHKDRTSRVVLIARDFSQGDLDHCLDVLRMRPKEVVAEM
ncbi:putative GTP-binding protein YjiA [Thalassovita autumnalis]|uniref:GTP-binding protein YjiA n=1 Tax=Thalassovita autumnalis TaxID=2072972 RepID=A0A0P1G0M4_9RHOB|nr:GTP-binding protein [Thalassovita autumnalis]CUH66813.1 putative GTP-binding protein YjiA [Thalassovita autumnalis]CUH71518.1 putative GTP-binding protein YjiA [Thalassovita autumnalis]